MAYTGTGISACTRMHNPTTFTLSTNTPIHAQRRHVTTHKRNAVDNTHRHMHTHHTIHTHVENTTRGYTHVHTHT